MSAIEVRRLPNLARMLCINKSPNIVREEMIKYMRLIVFSSVKVERKLELK